MLLEAVAEPASTRELGAGLNSVAPLRSVLLAIFDSDQSRAEEKYRELYRKLVRYFGWYRGPEPEDLAQEALIRGFSRLRQGQQITTEHPEHYFFGIARNLIREQRVRCKEEPFPEEDFQSDYPLFYNLNRGEQRVFIKECLRDLSPDDLEMLIAYLAGKGNAWAREAGVRPATFRSRVHRVRRRLQMFALAGSGLLCTKPAKTTA